MCGIFGYSGKRGQVAQEILDGLKELEYRGYDSWGVAVMAGTDQDPVIEVEKEIGKIGNYHLSLPETSVGIGHTRWATHGGVTRANAHPHLDCGGRLAVIHNGIIENFETLKSELGSEHTFISETDTEVVPHLLEAMGTDLPIAERVRLVFNKLEGMNVIAVLDAESGHIVAAKKGSPLVVGMADEGSYLASDASAILPHTRQIIFIEDGWLVDIDGPNVVIRLAESGQVIEVQPQTIDWQISQASLGEFDHFMIKEIYDQPKVLRLLAQSAEAKTTDLVELCQQSAGIFMIGCGTASYAALSGTYLFSRIAKQHVNFVAASEFFYQEQYLTPKSLILAISQSGETMDIVESVQLAQKHQSKIAAITNSLGSTLYRLSDASVLLDAGIEKAVCSTKAFTAMVAILLLLAYRLDERLDEAVKLLYGVADAVEQMLQPDYLQSAQEVADYCQDFEHLFIIGRGLSYAAALEAALKIKEVSYIHAEGFAGGELKHGVIALVDKGTPCMVFAPNDETEAAIISNAMELKARGGYIIGVGPKDHSVFDVWLPTASVGDASIMASVIPAQLLGYYLAVAKGFDPDKPRNLAKSVTVK